MAEMKMLSPCHSLGSGLHGLAESHCFGRVNCQGLEPGHVLTPGPAGRRAPGATSCRCRASPALRPPAQREPVVRPQAWPQPWACCLCAPPAAPFLQLGRVQDAGCGQYSEGVYSLLFYIGLYVITSTHTH